MSGVTRESLLSAGVATVDVSKILGSDLSEREVGHILIRPEVGEQMVLGYDADVPLVVDAGQVLALDGTCRLVNSTVAAFVDMLRRYGEYVLEVADASNDEACARIARQAVNEMRCLDPVAFAKDDNYWPIVCAQMIEGNL